MSNIKNERVLCVVATDKIQYHGDKYVEHSKNEWQDVETKEVIKIPRYVMPIIDHLHNDVENGQRARHYHGDGRVLDIQNMLPPHFSIRHAQTSRIFVDNDGKLKEPFGWTKPVLAWLYLDVDISKTGSGATTLDLISKSKFKHKCIHKGKCPHRGYDLSNVPAIDGVITCPLHSKKFNAETGEMIN